MKKTLALATLQVVNLVQEHLLRRMIPQRPLGLPKRSNLLLLKAQKRMVRCLPRFWSNANVFGSPQNFRFVKLARQTVPQGQC